MVHAVKSRMTEQKQWYLEEQQKYINTTDDKTDNTFDLQEAIKQINLNKKHMQKLQVREQKMLTNLCNSAIMKIRLHNWVA